VHVHKAVKTILPFGPEGRMARYEKKLLKLCYANDVLLCTFWQEWFCR
jgi:hypothetical protein